MVRHITKYEAEPQVSKLLQADYRARLKRLGNLGVNGHQPSVAAYCELTGNEKVEIADAILKQKVANNLKAEKRLAEHRERQALTEGNNILLRLAMIAIGASVRWKKESYPRDQRQM